MQFIRCDVLRNFNMHVLRAFGDVTSISLIFVLFACFIALIEVGRYTFIALIPKVDIPQCLNDFRPISLVGSMYKILAKVRANRLRSVIGSVASDTQSAFIKGR
jgi:hypothetical protein